MHLHAVAYETLEVWIFKLHPDVSLTCRSTLSCMFRSKESRVELQSEGTLQLLELHTICVNVCERKPKVVI